MTDQCDEQYAEHARGERQTAEDGDDACGHAEPRPADGVQTSGPERNGHDDEEDRQESDHQRQDVDQQQEDESGTRTGIPGNPPGQITGADHRPARGVDRPLEEATGVVEPRRHRRLDRIIALERPDDALVLLDRGLATDTLERRRIEQALVGIAVVGLVAVRTTEADLADLELEVSRTERVPAFGTGAGRQVPERVVAFLATHGAPPSAGGSVCATCRWQTRTMTPSGRRATVAGLSPRDTPRRCVVGTPPPVAG